MARAEGDTMTLTAIADAGGPAAGPAGGLAGGAAGGPAAGEIVLLSWRHHDRRVTGLPGIALPPLSVPAGQTAAAVALRLYGAGARRVEVAGPVDLSGDSDPATSLRALALVRELTGHGVQVDWRLRLGPEADDWWLLNHLQPPAELAAGPAGDQIRQTWAESFHLNKCVYRQAPGFIQIRDRRAGELNRLTVDEPDYLSQLDPLLDVVPAAAVPTEIADAYAAEGLIWPLADLLLWLPYRVRRWPWPAMLV